MPFGSDRDFSDQYWDAEMLDKLGDWLIGLGVRMKAWARKRRENHRIRDARLSLLPLLIFALKPFGLDLKVHLFIYSKVPKKVGHLSVIEGGNDAG